MDRRLAIMKNISFGVRDRNKACLWFDVNDGNYGSLQCLPVKYAVNLIEKHNITDIRNLEGKPCWIEVDNNIMKFIDLADTT